MAEATNGLQQMAVTMMNPQFAAQQQKFALQQAMAQQMMEQGAQQPATAQLANPGGMVVQNSPVAALARALQQGTGGYLAGKNIQDQIQYYKNLPQNSGPSDPNSMNQTELLHDMMARGSGTAEYQNRMAGSKAAAEAFGKAPATPLTLPDGTVVPLSNVVGNSAQPTPPQAPPMSPQSGTVAPPTPVTSANLPPPQTTPQQDAALSNAVGGGPMPPVSAMPAPGNVMPNVMRNTPKVNPNSPEGAANAAGLKAADVKYGETAADTAKNLDVMTSKLPLVLERLDKMENAAKTASFGYGVTNEGDGSKQDIHDQLADKTANANNTLLQLSAQGVLPELGPQLQGMKGNKFIESLAASSSGLNMKAPPESKAALIQGLRTNYIGMIKSTAAQMRSQGQRAPSDAEIDNMVTKMKPQTAPQSNGWSYGGVVK